jgi:DNA repair exonuclease SbcCD nuclease subunit
MVQLALIGDLHLSERSPRHGHVLEVLDWVIDDLVTVKAEWGSPVASVLLGDLFEGQASAQVYLDLLTRIQRLCQLGPVGVVLGNHEAPDGIEFFPLLDGDVTAAGQSFQTMTLPGCRVLLVPYPRRGRPPFQDLADGGSVAGALRAAAARIADTIRSARQAWHGTPPPLIVCGHFTIEGMRIHDHEFEVHSAHEIVVPQAAFEDVALAAVGHIHSPQDVAPRIIGVGSLIRHSFAEASDPKSYTLVTVDDGAVRWERRGVPCRGMQAVRLHWGPALRQQLAEANPLDFGLSTTGQEVKFTIEIPEDQVATFDPTVFDPAREAAAHFVLEKIVLPAQRTRAPEITHSQGLGDQLGTWLVAVGQAIDARREERLAAKVAELEG